jgi:hypothetical protein
MMNKLLDVHQSYTFSKIFDMKIEPSDLAADLGYGFRRTRLNLPRYNGELPKLGDVRSNIESIMPYVTLSNETTRREVMVSQVVFEVVRNTKAELRIEYPIKVTEQLQGVLDYLLRSQTELLVIEAKRDDLDYGFTQLVAEMIALDQWERSPDQPKLLGAVTTGQLWQFGLLDRATKHIAQGLDLYRVTEDLDILIRILIQALLP